VREAWQNVTGSFSILFVDCDEAHDSAGKHAVRARGRPMADRNVSSIENQGLSAYHKNSTPNPKRISDYLLQQVLLVA
jgi:hypothetical protein